MQTSLKVSTWRRYGDWVLEPIGMLWLLGCAGLILATALGRVNFSWWETIGFVTGLLSVWLAAKEHVSNWPIGLVNSVAFFWLFLQYNLYGSAFTQLPYLALSVWGWWMWLKGGANQTELPVSRLKLATFLALVGSAGLGTWVLTWLFTFTNNPSPLFDAATTALSFAALYLLTIKVLENWWIWMAADIIFILLYLSQGLFLTAALYGVFFVLCIHGYVGWRHQILAMEPKVKQEAAWQIDQEI